MKKIFSLLLLALPLIGFTSCDDDKDVPNVDFSVNIDGGTRQDGVVYVKQGTTLTVSSIEVSNKEQNKNAGIVRANYYWDYEYIGTSIEPPYGFEINISENVPEGKHLLEIECPVLAEGYSPATSVISIPVVVEAADDQPAEGDTDNGSDNGEDTGAQSFVVTGKTVTALN